MNKCHLIQAERCEQELKSSIIGQSDGFNATLCRALSWCSISLPVADTYHLRIACDRPFIKPSLPSYYPAQDSLPLTPDWPITY